MEAVQVKGISHVGTCTDYADMWKLAQMIHLCGNDLCALRGGMMSPTCYAIGRNVSRVCVLKDIVFASPAET